MGEGRTNEPFGEIANRQIFENDHVRIWHLIVEPGEHSPWHQHGLDYVVVATGGGDLMVQFDDGTEENFPSKAGETSYLDDRVPHRVYNQTNETYANVLIELKDTGKNSPPPKNPPIIIG